MTAKNVRIGSRMPATMIAKYTTARQAAAIPIPTSTGPQPAPPASSARIISTVSNPSRNTTRKASDAIAHPFPRESAFFTLSVMNCCQRRPSMREISQ